MKTHDEKTQQHIDAICDVFKKEPERILIKGFSVKLGLDELHDDPFAYSIKPKPIATGHNPDNLTVEQVGEGWRLLEKDEIKTRPETSWLNCWQIGGWNDRDTWSGWGINNTYRTRLSREQLALLDKQEGWIPWFGSGEIPTGMVDVISNAGRQVDSEPAARWGDIWKTKDHAASIIAYRPAKLAAVPWADRLAEASTVEELRELLVEKFVKGEK